MMVGPAAVTHIADLHLDVLVDAGAALVVLSRSLSLRLSLFISKQATNFLTPANAIQTFSYGVLFLFQLRQQPLEALLEIAPVLRAGEK